MTTDIVVNLSMEAMQLALKIGLPLLLAGLVVGLLISVFQAVTQIQEQTLTFIPKILAVAAVIIVMGPWMLGEVVGYTSRLYEAIPKLIGT